MLVSSLLYADAPLSSSLKPKGSPMLDAFSLSYIAELTKAFLTKSVTALKQPCFEANKGNIYDDPEDWERKSRTRS